MFLLKFNNWFINLTSSDIEVLVLDIGDLNKHKSTPDSIIAKVGEVNTYWMLPYYDDVL